MQSPASSIVFSVNGYSLHYYGLIMFCAIVVALFVMKFIAKHYYKDIDREVFWDILPPIIICSILGARLYYVLLDFDYFANHISEIFAVWHGGLSIHGAIFGGVIAGLIVSKLKKISFLKYADVFAFGLTIGQSIGRFGNYFNCEAFGKPCSIPFLQLYIPVEHRPLDYVNYEYFHPTFLYESIWDLFVFVFLLFLINKFKALKSGVVFFAYLIMYSIGRFFIEQCRLDSVLNIGGIAVAQLVSVLIIFVACCSLGYIYKKKGQDS